MNFEFNQIIFTVIHGPARGEKSWYCHEGDYWSNNSGKKYSHSEHQLACDWSFMNNSPVLPLVNAPMHQWMYKKERNLDMVTITQPTLADAEKPRDKAHSCSSDHKCDKLKSQIFWCSVKFKKNWTWMNMIGWSRGEKENSFGDGKIASRGKPGILCRTGWDFSV